tara:strand:+ start:136 stop:762 length:627 start_codon:yes stop_codon:yes gene_type:complete
MISPDSIFEATFKQSIKVHEECILSNLESLQLMADGIVSSILSGGKLFLCGNGGSAADSQHLAAELIVRLTSANNRIALPAVSLSMDSSTLTACGNDYGFDQIFSRPLEALGRSGDCLLAISTSGNSKNVINALLKARDLNIHRFGFLGAKKGQASELCDCFFTVPSENTARIQECHITAGHALMTYIEEKIITVMKEDELDKRKISF